MLVSFDLDDFDDGGSVVRNLTLRDYFAAVALRGLLANPELQNHVESRAKVGEVDNDALGSITYEKDPKDYEFWMEEWAWDLADSMLYTRSCAHKLFSYPLSELDLDNRILRGLHAVGITTIGELCKQHRFTIKRIPNLGKVSFEKIEAALAAHNLKLKGS